MNCQQVAQVNQLKFYTVPEAAQILRVDPATIYRAIRANEFPVVRVRTRYVIPVEAVERIAARAARTGSCVDIARLSAIGEALQ